VYALAAEAVLNVAPARLTLSFLRPGESFTWAWDEASRRRTIELVTEALAASMR